MKKICSYSIVAILLLMVASCQKATRLTADSTLIGSLKEGGSGKVHLHSDADNYSVEQAPDWVETSIVDSTLFYFLAENTTETKREGSVVVSCGGKSISIPVKQANKLTKLNLSKNSVSFEQVGGEERILIDCDGYGIKVDCPNTIKAFIDGKALVVKASPTDGPSHAGVITLTIGDLTANVDFVIHGEYCGTCAGTGQIKCPKCHGEGTYEKADGFVYGCARCGGDDSFPPENHGQILACQGRGLITCPDCNGKGK